jgi:hypothetical protein
MTLLQQTISKKEYLASYYKVNKEKIKLTSQKNSLKYKEKWANATEDQKAERRKKCNEYTSKTKPWLTRRKRRPEAYLYNLAKQRSKRRGIEFSIDVEDLKMPEICPLLGIKLDSYSEKLDFHPSIDRIDSSKGYIKGNVWIVSHRANKIKNNASAEELIKIGNALMEALL